LLAFFILVTSIVVPILIPQADVFDHTAVGLGSNKQTMPASNLFVAPRTSLVLFLPQAVLNFEKSGKNVLAQTLDPA